MTCKIHGSYEVRIELTRLLLKHEFGRLLMSPNSKKFPWYNMKSSFSYRKDLNCIVHSQNILLSAGTHMQINKKQHDCNIFMFLNDYNYIFSHGLSMFGCGKRDTNYSFSILCSCRWRSIWVKGMPWISICFVLDDLDYYSPLLI